MHNATEHAVAEDPSSIGTGTAMTMMFGSLITYQVLSLVFVCARFWGKSISKSRWYVDDYVLIFSWVSLFFNRCQPLEGLTANKEAVSRTRICRPRPLVGWSCRQGYPFRVPRHTRSRLPEGRNADVAPTDSGYGYDWNHWNCSPQAVLSPDADAASRQKMPETGNLRDRHHEHRNGHPSDIPSFLHRRAGLCCGGQSPEHKPESCVWIYGLCLRHSDLDG